MPFIKDDLFAELKSIFFKIFAAAADEDKKQTTQLSIGNTVYYFDPPNIDNLIAKEEKTTDFMAAKPIKKEEAKMPPKFADGSVRQRGNVYEYRFMHEGKQRCVFGKSESEYFQKRADVMAGKDKHKNKHTTLLFDKWVWDWYNRFRRSKQGNQAQINSERRISSLASAFAKTPLSKLTGEELQDYINKYNHVPAEQEKILVLVRSSFEKALKLGHIKKDPCEALEVKKHKNKHYPVIQLAEQRKIFESEQPAIYCKIFMLYCCTGLRLTELYNALPHIDFDNNLIYVVDEDKATKKHQRAVPFLLELLTKADRDDILLKKPKAIQSHFVRLFGKLNIKAVQHSFRVTFISCCNHIGINPKQIQAWAGHTKIEMTMDTYAKLLKNDGTSPILEYLKRLKQSLSL